MKKFLCKITILVFLTLGGCSKTNTPPPTPPIPSELILGKWYMKAAIGNYTDYGVNQKDTTWFTPADYFIFNADSSINIMADGVAYNGKWLIQNNKQLMITGTHYMDFGPFDLPILTATDLQIYDTLTTANTALEQKLNLYR